MGVEYQQSGLIKNFYLLTEKFAVYLLSVAILYRIPISIMVLVSFTSWTERDLHKGVNNLFAVRRTLVDNIMWKLF